MIALISSVPEEGELLCKQIKGCHVSRVTGHPLLIGRIHGKDIVFIISGIGKTNAAHAATVLLEKYSPDMVILFGVGGAYPYTGLKGGDIAVAEKEVYGDEGVIVKNGFQGTEGIGIPILKKGRKRYFNEFPLDKTLCEKALKSGKQLAITHPPIPPLPRGGKVEVKVKSGTFITVSTCTGTRERAIELKKRFNAICENMEGASVAHICTFYGTPMIEIRGISNIVEDRDKGKWDIRLAEENCQKAVKELLKNL